VRRIMALMLSTLVAFAVGGAAWVLVAPPAKAEFPGHNGRIAFMKQDSHGFWQTWVANKDLSNQVKLTSGSADSGWAVWKPGGAKLAFDSDGDIFKMNPAGTGLVNLTDSHSFDADAGWSPDGSKIAFESDRRKHQGRTEIYVMDSEGSHVRRVSTLPERAQGDFAPRFSPDGTKLVFTRYRGDPKPAALFTIRIDGSGLRRLTPWSNGAGDADWAPGGKKLVFEANPNNRCRGDVYTVDSDGQHLKNITDNRSEGGIADPVWSPDGKKILFQQARAFEGGFGFGLAKMKPDGTDRHFILPNPVTNPEEMHQPDWESVP
jgi:Tol biopolymer transport system component